MNNDKWFNKYNKLSGALFTYDNSGNKARLATPFNLQHDEAGDIVGLDNGYGIGWVVLGYTYNLPIAKDNHIGLMFENKANQEQLWWHYPIDYNDYKIIKTGFKDFSRLR